MMGRRKLPIEYIQNDKSRRETFKKRMKGLKGKAEQLATLCNVQVGLVVIIDGKVHEAGFGPGGMDFGDIVNKYAMNKYNMYHYSTLHKMLNPEMAAANPPLPAAPPFNYFDLNLPTNLIGFKPNGVPIISPSSVGVEVAHGGLTFNNTTMPVDVNVKQDEDDITSEEKSVVSEDCSHDTKTGIVMHHNHRFASFMAPNLDMESLPAYDFSNPNMSMFQQANNNNNGFENGYVNPVMINSSMGNLNIYNGGAAGCAGTENIARVGFNFYDQFNGLDGGALDIDFDKAMPMQSFHWAEDPVNHDATSSSTTTSSSNMSSTT